MEKYIFLFGSILFLLLLFSFSTKADLVEISGSQSTIILHDNFFEGENILPYRFKIDKQKKRIWGFGNWENNKGYANISFNQLGTENIFTDRGLIPKKVLKNWNVKDYQLGKKKSFKSSGSPAVVQLATIKGHSCFIFVSKFGKSDAYGANLGETRTAVDGFLCKYSGSFTIEYAMNFLGCIELFGEGNARVGKFKDPACTSSTDISAFEKEESSEQATDDNKLDDSIETKLVKLKNLFDKKLITKEEYDQKRKEILDEM